MELTIETLAAEPRWQLDQTRALPGRSRGDLLGPWGVNVGRRFGPTALQRVRARLPSPLDRLSESLGAKDWLPVYAQLLVTEAIVDELLGGDMRALYPLLVEDTRAGMGRVHLALARSLGAGRALRLGPRAFRKIHERGSVDCEVSGRTARLSFTGTPLFAQPTWRLLQLFATRTLLELAGTPGTAVGESGGPEIFIVRVTW